MALFSIDIIDKIGWAGNTKSLGSIIVSAGWAGEALAVLEKWSVIRAVLASSIVLIPDLVVAANEAL